MLGIIEPYSGHFYECRWLEWDNTNEKYKSPISFRIKGNANIGVSTGLKETIQIFEGSRPIDKKVMKVHTNSSLDFKPKDKVLFIQDNTKYVIVKVSDDLNHPNSMSAFQFKSKVPKVLYLGDS